MVKFLKIVEGLEVGPALHELAGQPQYWLRLNPDRSLHVPLLGADNRRLLEGELAASWRLIDAVLARAARIAGDAGASGG